MSGIAALGMTECSALRHWYKLRKYAKGSGIGFISMPGGLALDVFIRYLSGIFKVLRFPLQHLVEEPDPVLQTAPASS